MKATKFTVYSAQILKFTNLNELSSFISKQSGSSIKCEALRAAGNILMKNQNSGNYHFFLEMFEELANDFKSFQVRDLLNFIYFYRVAREKVGFAFDFKIHWELQKKINELVINNRALETAEIIALYYDLKRAKINYSNLDDSVLEWVSNRNVPFNIVQLTILMKTVLNSVSLYNLQIISKCLEKVNEISFDFDLNTVIFDLVDLAFEIDHKLHWGDYSQLFDKIFQYICRVELKEGDILQVINSHLKYNKKTKILDKVLEIFMEKQSGTCTNIELLFYVIHLYNQKALETHPNYNLLIESIQNSLRSPNPFKKFHILLQNALTSISSPHSNSQITAVESVSSQIPDILALAYLLKYSSCPPIKNTYASMLSHIYLNKSDLSSLLESYLVIKSWRLSPSLTDLESSLRYTINKKILNQYENSQIFIIFLSKPFNQATRLLLKDITMENLPIILNYSLRDHAYLRSLITLYYDHETWYKQADSFIATRDADGLLDFIVFSYFNEFTIAGLTYLYNKMVNKKTLSAVSIAHLWMHPTLWTNRLTHF